jgi:hypothetical protein
MVHPGGRFEVKLDRQQAAQLELDVVSSLWLPKGIATPTHGGGARSKGLRAADKPGIAAVRD